MNIFSTEFFKLGIFAFLEDHKENVIMECPNCL